VNVVESDTELEDELQAAEAEINHLTWKVHKKHACLWQALSRDHFGENISAEDWYAFVNEYKDAFAEAATELAREMWEDYQEAKTCPDADPPDAAP